ncbi:hypothetical protein BDM02DRAFT_3098965 [Thelephora ganbajun]|uniref:Uncharacterized protein n=1 Tax=Thelephora ganbajun TaxID=370292 RepID=A0ACB6ZBD9_THEGA|nr:hypothetical protein BDM02DRAFT_3098965 [Thelephora ganbajun]
MTPSTFPPELLDSICSLLPTTDLVAVASANYTLNAVAQRTLYRTISITPAANNLSVLSTLTARPHIAIHVRTFSITIHHEQPHTFYTLLAKALEQMTELTSLTLFLDADASWVLNSEAHYLNLTSFASSFPFDSNLVDFLSRTPLVVDLQVGSALPSSDQPEINLPPSSIPNLARFTGPHHTARVVVPQRPVEALFLSEVISDDSIFGQLSQSKSNIIIFDAVVSLGLLPCVTAISQAMPSLHYLRLMTVAPLDEYFDPSLYQQLSDALGSMSALASFDYSGMNWTCWNDSDSKRVWQSSPPTPNPDAFQPPAEHTDDIFEFSENMILF